MELEEFLKGRDFEPLRVTRLQTVPGNGLELELEPTEGGRHGAFTLRILGIVDSDLQINELSFEVEYEDEFAISGDDALLWDYGSSASIFGDAPLLEPARFFAEFTDLVQELNVRRRNAVLDYLRADYATWGQRVTSHSHRVLTAPNPIVDRATALLDAQGAEYRVLRNNDATDRSLRVVDVGHNWFVCGDAKVVRKPETGPSSPPGSRRTKGAVDQRP